MKLSFILLLALLSLETNALEVRLTVSEIELSRDNRLALDLDKNIVCDNFEGTLEGNTIEFLPEIVDGSGRFEHTVYARYSAGFQIEGTKFEREFIKTVKGEKTVKLPLPKLKESSSFVQQSVMLSTRDLKTGERASSNLLFTVSRPVILARQTNGKGCFQVYPAFKSVSGILTNGSTNPSQLLIRHGIQEIWNHTRGAQWGFYFSPLAWAGIGNIFSFYANHFRQFSHQTTQTIEVSAGYQLSPGDMVQLYEQRTRYVDTFDAWSVGACGEAQKLEGDYFVQWWGTAFHAAPYNPWDNSPPPTDIIGAPSTNQCDDDLTPDFGGAGDFTFVGTI
jgi:hypothetical protein